jgi:hypothetical protein
MYRLDVSFWTTLVPVLIQGQVVPLGGSPPPGGGMLPPIPPPPGPNCPFWVTFARTSAHCAR